MANLVSNTRIFGTLYANNNVVAGSLELANSTTTIKFGDGTYQNTAMAASFSPAFYGNANSIVVLTTDSYGRVSSATNTYIGISPTQILLTTGTNYAVLNTSPFINTAFMNATTITSGTATVAPLKMASGTVLATPAAGVIEYDGSSFYHTVDTSSGRGYVPTTQMFKYSANAAAISVTANGTPYFGTNSAVNLAAGGVYEIEYNLVFLATTANIRNFTWLFSLAPTAYTVDWAMSPVTGLVPPPGTATTLVGQHAGLTAANYTVATASLTTGVNYFVKAKFFVASNASASNMHLYAWTSSSGSITPLAGSYWKATRLPSSNTGTFAT